MPYKKADRRIPEATTLSPKERKALARVHGSTPFATWAREVLMEKTKTAT